MVIEKRMLRRIFVPKRGAIIGGLRKLNNEVYIAFTLREI
jgi:hypothetical protein